MARSVFVSTTLPYVNGNPHLGHAFEYVQADVYARHARQCGYDVFLASGTDENSLRNVHAARSHGLKTGELVTRRADVFHSLLTALSVAPDRFVRTSADPEHIDGARALWKRIEARGDLYTRDYEGLYCESCEQFVSTADLVAGCCPVHKAAPTQVRERNYFFRLSRYQDDLLAALTDGRINVTPAVRAGEAQALVRGGLTDISVSRSAKRAEGWGIPVPGDPDQVMYVWFDALTSYINALGGPSDVSRHPRYWTGAHQRLHVLGKDVLRFHAVFWPAMLMSAGLPLPTHLAVHGHITSAGQKLSKTSGNVIDPSELIEHYGAQALRYVLLSDFSPWSDSDFTESRLVARYNADLAGGLGNLLDRVVALLHRFRGGVVPGPGTPGTAEYALLAAADTAARRSHNALERFDHREAISHIRSLVRQTNAYLSDREPWSLAMSQGERAPALLDAVLHCAVTTLCRLAVLLAPYLPEPAAAMRRALGMTDDIAVPDGQGTTAPLDVAGQYVSQPLCLFPRLELSR